MAEKYGRNKTRNAHDDVAKRAYYVTEGRIRTIFHYDDPRVTRNASVTFKDRNAAPTIAGDDVQELEEDVVQQVGSVLTITADGAGWLRSGQGALNRRSSPKRKRRDQSRLRQWPLRGLGRLTDSFACDLWQVLLAEKECFTAIRHSQLEMTKLISQRSKEEREVKLERPIYERAWEK